MTATPFVRSLSRLLRDEAHHFQGQPSDFDAVLARASRAHFVLIGEASHGTHEFYRIRAEITKRLIREQGFSAVAVEADWPDAYRVNRYVRDESADNDSEEALRGFRRFPQWMWRNADVLDFVGWLRAFNDAISEPARRVGFYGLDLYSLHASMAEVVRYLRSVDPEAARRAVQRYGCFDRHGDDPQSYGYAATLGLSSSCENEVVAQLTDLRRAAASYVRRDGRVAEDDLFEAEQNARVVANAERYYRAMFGSRTSSWNLRDRHMAGTLEALYAHLGRRTHTAPRIVVWAHNSHLGDARATEMGDSGEVNVGQLVREAHGPDCVLIGFSTASGTVTAASDWDEPAERKQVRSPLPQSWEALFHEVGPARFGLDTGAPGDATAALREPRLERAIGVIYRPETERLSHYFQARLATQFDYVMHYDVTRAVEPLERSPEWERGELPETYPTAL
jgi:erythromycin esterase-like protein